MTARREAYQNYKNGLNHRMNGEKLGISENTIRSWCKRDAWKLRKLEGRDNHLFMRRLSNGSA